MDSQSLCENALYSVDKTPAAKEEVLKKISAMASGHSELSAYTKEDIFLALMEREGIGSTGYENGVALPHCSLEMAKGFVSGVLVVPGGIDFGAVDGKNSLVFAFIIGPTLERNSHIQLLSAYSRILSDTSALTRISAADNSHSLKEIFSEYAQKIDDSHFLEKRKPQNLVLMVLQKKEYFEDFLQVFAATVDAAITVLESNNAGSFLHRMPLFSSFWSESQASFNRIIVAIVDREKSNDLIRRLNTALKNYEEPKGFMITVQELAYTIGSLEF